MSFSPKYIPVSGRNETYVHGVSPNFNMSNEVYKLSLTSCLFFFACFFFFFSFAFLHSGYVSGSIWDLQNFDREELRRKGNPGKSFCNPWGPLRRQLCIFMIVYVEVMQAHAHTKTHFLLHSSTLTPPFPLLTQGYQLVITGHSLGAGVASVLALLLRPEYPRLICYAYSPPGCICRLAVRVLVLSLQ